MEFTANWVEAEATGWRRFPELALLNRSQRDSGGRKCASAQDRITVVSDSGFAAVHDESESLSRKLTTNPTSVFS